MIRALAEWITAIFLAVAILAGIVGGIVWLATPARPAASYCELALSLGIDRSGSIDKNEREFVASGMINALAAPEIADALSSGTVWLHVFSFSSTPSLLHDWHRVAGPEDLHRVARMIEAPAPPPSGTSLTNALSFARDAFDAAPSCNHYVLDLMTDGNPDAGHMEAGTIRGQMARFERYLHQVNVLYVGSDPRMIDFARRELLFGVGAFMEIAPTFAEFERAMVRKLSREIAGAFQRAG